MRFHFPKVSLQLCHGAVETRLALEIIIGMGGSVYFCWPQPDGANQVDVIITGPEFCTPWSLQGVAVVGSDLEYEAKCNFQVTPEQ